MAMGLESATAQSYTLYVYYTRYSSWGARVQLVLDYFQIPHEVRYFNYTIPALTPPPGLTTLPVLGVSPAGGDDAKETLRIPDSLAICEFLAEQHPGKPLWPRDPHLRALARAAAARMHSGFAALRDAYPTNYVASFSGPGLAQIHSNNTAIASDVHKLVALWGETREAAMKRLEQLGEADDGFLCGGFSIADAFFWPVLWRLRSYRVPLTGITTEGLQWMRTMWNDPVMMAQGAEYFHQAQNPETRMPMYDEVFKHYPDITSAHFDEKWVFDATSPSLSHV